MLGIAVFTCCWAVRQWLPAPAWVLALSELTYAVYLLHNWLFDVFLQAFQRLGLRDVYASLATLALLGPCVGFSCVASSGQASGGAARWRHA